MSSHHLRNTELSLKAKGLLSLMLSLPEDWDYTTKGLAHICKDGVDSITTALKDLERHGYLTRQRLRYENGQLGDIEYTIHEQYGKEHLDETVELMLEVVLSKRPYIRIAGDDFPREVVKSRFLKINASHLEHVFDCIDKNTTGYTSESGTNSTYLNLLPSAARRGITLTTIYGWKPGASLPVSGINADDYKMATQVILWEYQQQLDSLAGCLPFYGPLLHLHEKKRSAGAGTEMGHRKEDLYPDGYGH